MKRSIFLTTLLAAKLIIFGCQTGNGKQNPPTTTIDSNQIAMTIPEPSIIDTTLMLSYSDTLVQVDLWKTDIVPSKGTLLLLNGWDLPGTDWCDTLQFCQKALQKGYHLIIPHFGKSVYSWQYYNETFALWKKFPHREWMWNHFISLMQKEYELLLPYSNNHIIGISTGSRGAALMACDDTTKIFKSIALLSGDYNQSFDKNDNLMKYTYGTYQQYPERWDKTDNVIHLATSLNCAVYIAHGKADNIVSPEYSIQLHDTLNSISNQKIVLHLDETAAHNYAFWTKELNAVLEFIEQTEK